MNVPENGVFYRVRSSCHRPLTRLEAIKRFSNCEASRTLKTLKRFRRPLRVSILKQTVKPDGADTLKTRSTLLSSVRKGSEDAWSQFYQLYENFVYSAARAAGLDHEESQDVVQETMLTVRDYISNFVPDRNRGRFRTWLRKLVQSRIADQYRRKKRNPSDGVNRERESAITNTRTSITDRIPNPRELELDRLIDGKLEQAILEEARRIVKDEVRMVDYQAYDLFEVQELSARDVALSLGIAAVTVRVRAFRVRRAVERQLRRIVRVLEQPNGGTL